MNHGGITFVFVMTVVLVIVGLCTDKEDKERRYKRERKAWRS